MEKNWGDTPSATLILSSANLHIVHLTAMLVYSFDN